MASSQVSSIGGSTVMCRAPPIPWWCMPVATRKATSSVPAFTGVSEHLGHFAEILDTHGTHRDCPRRSDGL